MEKKLQKRISYRLQLINSTFIASLLSKIANNLAKGIHKIKCKYGHDNEKYKACAIKYKDCKCCFG